MDTILRTDLPTARLPGHRWGRTRGLARRLALGIVNLMIVWQQRLEDRDRLQGMGDAQLRDIGITRADVAAEAGKPFWRA